MSRELLQQALDLIPYLEPLNASLVQQKIDLLSAIRTALASPEQPASEEIKLPKLPIHPESMHGYQWTMSESECIKAYAEQAVELNRKPASEDKPVAWFEKSPEHDAWFLAYSENPKAETKPLFTRPAPAKVEDKPVAWAFFYGHESDAEMSHHVFDSKAAAMAWWGSEDCLWDGHIAAVYLRPAPADQDARDAALEEAAQLCNDAIQSISAYEIIGDRRDAGTNTCTNLAARIRAMKGEKK